MALNFPANPTTGDQYTAEGVTYRFFENRWVIDTSTENAPVEIVGADISQGWQVWGDVLVQWGQTSGAAGNEAVVFAQEFKTVPRVTANQAIIDAVNIIGVTTGNHTTTGFDVRSKGIAGGNPFDVTNPVDWVAIGEAPDALKKPKEIGVAVAGGGGCPFPVGAIYESTLADDPSTIWADTTWEAFAAGRVTVGVGDNGEATWAAGEERGSEEHTLTEAEMPAHTHTYSRAFKGVLNGVGGFNDVLDLSYNNQTTQSAGGNEAHNNVQPSIGTYKWKRLT